MRILVDYRPALRARTGVGEYMHELVRAYTAEYGLKGGSQINFITKSGGSEYHGTAYTHIRDDRFNSINYFNKKNNLPKPVQEIQNFGGTLGGPVPRIPIRPPKGDGTQASGSRHCSFYSRSDKPFSSC